MSDSVLAPLKPTEGLNGPPAKGSLLSMRPRTVTVTTWLMAVLNIFGYALLWDLQEPKPVVIAIAVIFTFLMAIGYVVLWFYWRGENWARILVLLTSVLCLYNLRSLSSANLVSKLMLVGEAAVAVFLIYWLNTAPAEQYFKRRVERG